MNLCFRTAACAVALMVSAAASAGQATYQALQSGDPGVPADGKTAGTGGQSYPPTAFQLAQPYGLATLGDGLMTTIFPQPPQAFTGSDDNYAGITIATPDLNCFTGTGFPINGLVTIDGVQGGFSFASREALEQLVAISQTYCSTGAGVQLEDMKLVSVTAAFPVADGENVSYESITVVDALAVGPDSDAVPGRPPRKVTDLSIDLENDGDSVAYGQLASFWYTVRNLGTKPAEKVTVTVRLPQGLDIVEYGTNGWICGGTSPMTCQLPSTMPGSGYGNFYVAYRAPYEPTTLRSSARVTTSSNDVTPSNNVDNAATQVVASCVARDEASFLRQGGVVVVNKGKRKYVKGPQSNACVLPPAVKR